MTANRPKSKKYVIFSLITIFHLYFSAGCNECLVGSEMNQGGMTTRYENVSFVNSPLRLFWSETYKEILWDIDGSLAGE